MNMFTLAALLTITMLSLMVEVRAVEKVQVAMRTSEGTITLELWPEKAPKTVENFVNYAQSGHYEGTIFHRVIDGFMIQGGGMNADMKEKSTRKGIVNEAANGLRNDLGTIAMARTSDVNSATSQFFINLSGNSFLNHRDESPSGFGYCVFGRVVDGMDVVNKIGKVKTASSGYHQDVPREAVLIEEISITR